MQGFSLITILKHLIFVRCFVDGKIVSYDAIVDENSNVVFATTHKFPVPNHLISLGACGRLLLFNSIDENLDKLAKNTIKAFEVKTICSFRVFKLNNDNPLIGKKENILV